MRGLFLVLALASIAAEPKTGLRRTVSAGQLKTWSEQFVDAADVTTREQVRESLFSYGERSVPFLIAQRKRSLDPHVRRRLDVLIAELEKDRLTAPRRVSLTIKGKTVDEALAELDRQSGYKIGSSGPKNQRVVHYACVDKPFWEALDDILQGSDLQVMRADAPDILLNTYLTPTRLLAYSGPIRMEIGSLTCNRHIPLGRVPRNSPAPKGGDTVYISPNFLAEPKVRVGFTTTMEILKAVDEFGGDMRFKDEEPTRREPFTATQRFGEGASHGSLTLRRVNGDSKRIAELHVRAFIPIETGEEVILEIPEILKASGKRFSAADMDVIFDSVEWKEPELHLKVTVVAKRGTNESLYTFGSAGQITDRDNRPFAVLNMQNQTYGENLLQFAYTVQSGENLRAKPMKFQFRRIGYTPIPYEFRIRNIELP